MAEIAPCIPINIPGAPTLLLPFSITPPPLPIPKLKGNFCCIDIDLSKYLPPLPLGPLIVNPAFVKVMRTAITAVQAYLDKLPIRCPRM